MTSRFDRFISFDPTISSVSSTVRDARGSRLEVELSVVFPAVGRVVGGRDQRERETDEYALR